ncbi:MAG: ribosome maturation factor RimM [Legionellaceae bacterium]|nr:ribosome maturation factor RimM [Legionellaceae bacterium]
MDKNNDWIVVGRFGRPQGLKGFIRVISFTEPQPNIMEYNPLYINVKGEWEPLRLTGLEEHTKFILVQVDGYQQREQIASLTNKDIAIRREQLPDLPPHEFYWHELTGMKVVTLEGHCLGRVTDIIATGSNDVLVVTGEKRHLIPYLLDDFVVKIDKDQQTITVDWDADF